ncbi:aspartyl-tRNA synthetase [Thermoactinomyces sp. DSM 45891]|uniref:aspartate--tRNA ligase n=1 Tax=Thermoactinomyces sp. DSM 45891 TaxID=1761907 RepID=UPI00090F2836|nr:aspartate--tRNA ligase [Thermoactinomyces sp. DSM 45891]SFX46114.1 aspartyl-tRNA synthetase [Thermoactinomyces sp. DSM 45891]
MSKPVLRTHKATELTTQHVEQVITLNGWVHSRRDLGGLIFLNIRDISGQVQVVVHPETAPEAFQVADQVRSEYVLSVTGQVALRAPGTINKNMATGEIEIKASAIQVFSTAKTPPFQILDNIDVDETIRLKHRYVDLRRPKIQENLVLRHKAMQSVRRFLDRHAFLEIETPIMTKSTPEGARDYLVPSRVHAGQFYALPQSPQIFKQLCMVGGLDRYFQFARCFRDEDLRADRQPEFTQIDLEFSFLELEEFYQMMEEMFVTLLREVKGVEVAAPFERIPYAESMERFGSDKPDLRFGMELINVGEVLAGTEFKVFASTLRSGGQVKAINVKGQAHWSRKEVDSWGKVAESLGAKGLAWLAWKPDGIKGSIAKALKEEEIASIAQIAGVEEGDLLFFVADKSSVVAATLGGIRARLGRELGLIDESKYHFAWITEFPMYEYDENTGQFMPMHHPFTRPMEEDISLMETDPGKVRAVCYDLVLNGYELGSGSLRIYERELQEKIFASLGLTLEESREKFGFLLEAFEYGVPPHGGIGLGFDRIVMILAGETNLREIIAFPKTSSASCLMTNAPSDVDEQQLDDLHIAVKMKEKGSQ